MNNFLEASIKREYNLTSKTRRLTMSAIETTKMTSKGQIVIPEETRKRLGLKAGDKFLVVGDKDIVVLKTLTSPSLDEFGELITAARKQAKALGFQKSDIIKAVAKARER
jgi:AbrB family looped-hinge helix DNA binding protein